MANIIIKNLSVGYDNKAVIKDCSLTIDDGSLFTLLGPSGCGKTTLLRTLAGFIPVTTGSVHFGKKDVTHTPPHLRDVGMVFQDYALFPDKTVFDNVAYGLRARGRDNDTIHKTVAQYLERVGLNGLEARRPAELSGGQRQRVALARALAIKPSVLLMDEPLSNLDAKLRVQVRETIADLQHEVGITTVLVTHDQEEALALSTRIGLVQDGTLAQVGTPHELYSQPNSAHVADFVGAANIIPVQIGQDAPAHASIKAKLEDIELTVTAGSALRQGSAMLLARPEALRVSAANTSNCLPATILRLQYLGPRSLITVRTDGGSMIRVEAHQLPEGVAAGARVFLQFDTLTRVVAS